MKKHSYRYHRTPAMAAALLLLFSISLPARAEEIHLPTPANPLLPTLFLVGDSTIHYGNRPGPHGEQGWGEPLAEYFDLSKINIDDVAINGRSSRTYINEGHWDEVEEMLKPGDFVLLQMGGSDGGAPDDAANPRASLKGVGEETLDFYNPLLRRQETVHSFGWYMRKYVADTLAKGATPILLSPLPGGDWKKGEYTPHFLPYAEWTLEVAAREKVGFVDLNTIASDDYETLGKAGTQKLFVAGRDANLAGAKRNAANVIGGLKALPGNPLGPFFSAKAAAIPAYKQQAQ